MLGPLQNLQLNQQQNQHLNSLSQQPQVNQPIPPPPPQNGQDFTLSSVLHFLQTEWRRYERDRNEWEIERAEMRARIALLEGERRSFENIKLDLMRRIKMLEYALRMERSKQLNPTLKLPVHPTNLSSTSHKDELQAHKGESGASSPKSEDSPFPDNRIPNGALAGSLGRPTSWGGTNGPTGTTHANLSKPPLGRDPKSRARSREYLKQCLQEITYLTSSQAMNPLPNRPLLNTSSMSLTLPNVPPFDQMAFRPRKVLDQAGKDFPPAKDFPPINGQPLMPGTLSATHVPILERGTTGLSSHPAGVTPPLQPNFLPTLPSPSGPQGDQDKESEHGQLTSIFQSDEAIIWKGKSRLSAEASEQVRLNRDVASAGANIWDQHREDEDEPKDMEGELEDDDSAVISEGEETKVWKVKRTFRNHLDAVRALAFHPTELCLATGSDDCTIKIWRVDVSGLASSVARPTTEVEPQLTLRGHSAAITRLIHAPSKGLLYSASLDSSIRVWSLPASSHTAYAPYDESRAQGELVGHTDAVWDLALVRDENILISCGAEGSVKIWDVTGPSGVGSLKLTWSWSDSQISDESSRESSSVPGATAVEALKSDLKKVAVAYQNAVIKVFDIESGKELTRLQSDMSYDGTPATQVNRISSHPTLALLVTAHEDKFIRIFDLTTGQCTHSMLAHLDGVTSLSIDPSGFSLLSGSHDCSIRFWDLLGSHACVQELTMHREKAKEGVLDVEFHATLPFIASAGADGIVKLYASS